MNSRRCEQREIADTFLRTHRHFQGNPSAERVPDDMRALQTQRLKQIEIDVGEVDMSSIHSGVGDEPKPG